jgi:RNA polymerase sigma-70 factor, ECF subfamily
MDDEEIVRRVLAGEGALFERIMRRYNQRLFRVVRSILGNDTEAEEVVQQAYVNAYLHLGQFKGEARFSTWLTRIAVHEASASSRRLRRFTGIGNAEEGERPMMSTDPDPERLAASAEMSRLLERLIDALPPANRTVFVMREVEGLSTSETAECLGITPDAVKVRLHRGKAALRKEILGQAGQAATAAFPFLGARCDRMIEAVFARLDLPLPAPRR